MDTSGSSIPYVADKSKSLPTKVSIPFMCMISIILLILFLFFCLQVKLFSLLPLGGSNDNDSEEKCEVEIIIHAPFNNITKDLLL